MRCIADVKCLRCARVCGEVRAPHPQGINLRQVPVGSGIRCGLKPEPLLRCSRCGGSIYIDEVECVYA